MKVIGEHPISPNGTRDDGEPSEIVRVLEGSRETRPALAAFIKQQLANGRSVIIGDNDHASPVPRQIIADRELLAIARRHDATLILEGPEIMNELNLAYRRGRFSASELADALVLPYHLNQPEISRAYRDSYVAALVRAKEADVRVFFPEKNSGFYKILESDPEAARALMKFTAGLTDQAHFEEQFDAVRRTMSPAELAALARVSPMLRERGKPQDDHDIATTIRTQPGPYVALYGEAHRANLAQELNAESIAILPSAESPFTRLVHTLPNYVYYAKEDRVEAIPAGSKAREDFIKAHLASNVVPPSDPLDRALGQPKPPRSDSQLTPRPSAGR